MSDGRIRDAGDAALLLELAPIIDEAVNRRAIAIAAAVRRMALTGVRDVLPAYRSVAVYFDPLVTDACDVRQALERAASEPAAHAEGRVIDVPVSYGGEDGPDLEAVARWAGMPPGEVIARHHRPEYRVFMVGFLPGFPYMGTVDPRIAAPRKTTPRLKVPAGSVGIAGAQTGIYPSESPGGWQIIGRTSLPLFDADQHPPARIAPGDRVRFVRASTSDVEATAAPRQADVPRVVTRPAVAAHAVVLHPGLLTTIQDEGRWGHQDAGVPVSGAMDACAHRIANALVGNPRDAATLEVTLAGPALRFDAETLVGIAGADLGATVDDHDIAPGSAFLCRSGSVLEFSGRRAGARAYVAFAGGLQVEPRLGSRSTHVRARLGGLTGTALHGGDALPLAHSAVEAGRAAKPGIRAPTASPVGGARLRVMLGPQDDWFAPAAFEVLQRSRFTVARDADRMGYRLTGARLPWGTDREMISDAAFTGAIQVTPAGDPILLMADRQTTGGYPQIAVVITADLPLAGQLMPGDWVEFDITSRPEALAALVRLEEGLRDAGA